MPLYLQLSSEKDKVHFSGPIYFSIDDEDFGPIIVGEFRLKATLEFKMQNLKIYSKAKAEVTHLKSESHLDHKKLDDALTELIAQKL